MQAHGMAFEQEPHQLRRHRRDRAIDELGAVGVAPIVHDEGRRHQADESRAQPQA